MGSKQAQEFIQNARKEPVEIKSPAGGCNFEEKKIHYRNVFETVSHIYRNEGVSTFSRGIGARMMLNIPSTAISWGTYEMVKGFLTGI
jgi:hypothetical protein